MKKNKIKTLSVILALSAIAYGSAGMLIVKNLNNISVSVAINSYSIPVASNIESTEAEAVVETDNKEIEFKTQKDEIWHKMLNSIDYYNSVIGKMIYSDSPNNGTYVNYQANLNKSEAYTKIFEVNISDISGLIDGYIPEYTDKNCFDIEVFTDGNSLVTLDNLEGTAKYEGEAVFSRENSEPIDDSERVTVEEDGNPGYYYRTDITNIYLTRMSLFPQEMAFVFLTDYDLWNIDGVEEYVGRQCFVISDKTSDDYGKKLNVDNFKFYVDRETGVLLKYIGYDELQNITAFLVTENIDFDNEIDIYKPDVTNYKVIN